MITKTKIKPFKVPHVVRHGEVACDLRYLKGFFYGLKAREGVVMYASSNG